MCTPGAIHDVTIIKQSWSNQDKFSLTKKQNKHLKISDKMKNLNQINLIMNEVKFYINLGSYNL